MFLIILSSLAGAFISKLFESFLKKKIKLWLFIVITLGLFGFLCLIAFICYFELRAFGWFN